MVDVGVEFELLDNPNYIPARGELQDSDVFDSAFFGISPQEATVMNPQHRVFLECAHAALEDAGYSPDSTDGYISLYAGETTNGYLLRLYNNLDQLATSAMMQLSIGNEKDFLTTFTSYKLNLRGPSIDVQAACSTSLVATCLACQSLMTFQRDLALAGGVSVAVPTKSGYLYQPEGILSPDGYCRAFDVRAQGTVAGSGVGVVVLKRREDALADRDHVYSVIRGHAINNDGAVKAGYAAPGVESQTHFITIAQAMAEVNPDSIAYIKAHGSGTVLGDPIEIAAPTRAFRVHTQRKQYCRVGSVKTNIGHLDSAAGIASLIKTVLAVHHAKVPPSLHFETPNPAIDFERSPFLVVDELVDWPKGGPRRAGVSALGIGGTNAHVVLEEAPPLPHREPDDQPDVLLVSAQTARAADTAVERLATHLRDHPGQSLADVAFTLQVGRKAFPHRRAVVCHDREDAVRALSGTEAGRLVTGDLTQRTSERGVAFMLPGIGDHYVSMAKGLYGSEPAIRLHIDTCAELVASQLGRDFREVFYPAPSAAHRTSGERDRGDRFAAFRRMIRPEGANADENGAEPVPAILAHPILFAVESADRPLVDRPRLTTDGYDGL